MLPTVNNDFFNPLVPQLKLVLFFAPLHSGDSDNNFQS